MIRPTELCQRMRIPGVLLAAMFFVFAVLVMRIISVESPVMASDEYAYFMTAKYDSQRSDVYRYDPAMQAVDNEFYPLMFEAWNAVSPQRTAMVGRVSNALLFTLSALLLFALFRRAFDRRTATMAAMLYLLLPFSFYATTVLPEVQFQFFVYLGVLLAVCAAQARTPFLVILPAVISGIAYFVKPHAVALIVATGAFFLLASIVAPSVANTRARSRLVSGAARSALYLVTVIAVIYAVRRLSAQGQPEDTTLVASFYGSYLSRLSSPQYLLQNLWSMLDYVVGHVWALAVMFAPGLLAIAAIWFRSARALRAKTHEGDSEGRSRERRLLALLVGLLCVSFLLMIAAFTNSASQVNAFEKYRLHGRYLEPLLPLLMVFSVWAVSHSRRTWMVGLSTAISVLFFAFYLRFQYHLYPWDYPDIFVFFTSNMKHWGMGGTNDWLIWVVVASSLVFLACCGLRRFQLPAYVSFLAVLFIGSHVQMSNWLRLHSETNRAAIDAGDALRDYLGQTPPGSGLVLVVDRYGRSSYFLMEFANLQHVQGVAPGSRFKGPVPPGVQWLIAPPDVHVDVAHEREIDFGTQRLYVLAEDASTVAASKPEASDISATGKGEGGATSDGRSIESFDFSDQGIEQRLLGFHEREPWGCWSSEHVSSLRLAAPVQGRVRLTLVGWVAPTHQDGSVVVRIGNQEQPIELTHDPGEHVLTFDVGAPAGAIEFETRPARVTGDGRSLGVAISRVRVERQD